MSKCSRLNERAVGKEADSGPSEGVEQMLERGYQGSCALNLNHVMRYLLRQNQ